MENNTTCVNIPHPPEKPPPLEKGPLKHYCIMHDIQARFKEIESNLKYLSFYCDNQQGRILFQQIFKYTNQINQLLEKSNIILRKLDAGSPDFLLSLRKQIEEAQYFFDKHFISLKTKGYQILGESSIFLGNELEADYEDYVSFYYSDPQLKIFIEKNSSSFQNQLIQLVNKLKKVISPFTFDKIVSSDLVPILEEFKAKSRTFKEDIVSYLTQEANISQAQILKSNQKLQKWNETFMKLVTQISHIPLFNDKMIKINLTLPKFNEALLLLFSNLESQFKKADKSLSPKTAVALENYVNQTVLQKAENILPIHLNPQEPKSYQVKQILDVTETTIASLKKQLEEANNEIEKLKQEKNESSTLERLKMIALGEQKAKNSAEYDKQNFIRMVIEKLGNLVGRSCDNYAKDPKKRFDYAYEIIKTNFFNEQQKIMFNKISTQLSDALILIEPTKKDQISNQKFEDLIDHAITHLKNQHNLISQCSLALQVNEDELLRQVQNLKTKDLSKEGTINLNENLKESTTDAQETFDTIMSQDEIQKTLDSNIKNNQIESTVNAQNELNEKMILAEKNQESNSINNEVYVNEVVKPIGLLTDELDQLISNDNAFNPSSESFPRYLSIITDMKGVIYKFNPDMVQIPVHRTIVRSIELLDKLTINLSALTYAPEYEKNQKAISLILSKYQQLNLSLSRLRVLLDEKDNQLLHCS